MRVIDWEEFIAENGDAGWYAVRDTDTLNMRTDAPTPHLAVTVGVFDGVHRGHQALIRRICDHPQPLASCSLLSTVVTFKQNPLRILKPAAFTGDIMTLEQKLHALEVLGVQLTVLIDFSEKFSKISGRDFVDRLLGRQVKFMALGQNFRCGCKLDTGTVEIRNYAEERGIDYWIAPSVMDEGLPVSSSRIRQALAAGHTTEAERLLGWSLCGIRKNEYL